MKKIEINDLENALLLEMIRKLLPELDKPEYDYPKNAIAKNILLGLQTKLKDDKN